MKTVTLALVFLTMTTCGRSAQVRDDTQLNGPVSFRVIIEQQNPEFCVEGPEFMVARNEDQWVTAFDMQTECATAADEVRLPHVDFDAEIAVAAWWKVAGCLGWKIQTTAVERAGDAIVVKASSTGPAAGEVCATALGGLESFLALERSERLSGAKTFRFVLDGKPVGSVAS